MTGLLHVCLAQKYIYTFHYKIYIYIYIYTLLKLVIDTFEIGYRPLAN